MRQFLSSIGLAATLMLPACGGDGGGQGGNPATSQSISGTAAAGVPLQGTVTVKDAAGATRTSAIGSNGQYTIDVTGLTAPFVFRAEGNVGGSSYVIHSAATSADVGGTINITPLTDLVLANIAGQIASTYFDQGQFSGVQKAQLDAEAGKLKEKLLPMLQAIGVDSSIDLLRTPFTPLASALDTALDQIRVSTDASTHMATITNVVTQQSIQDDLAVKAAQETAPPKLDDVANLNAASSDIPKIREALLAFSAKFATGLPATGLLAPYLSDNFLDHDRTKAAFLNEVITFSDLVGVQFTNVVIDAIDYTDTSHITAKVGFDIVDSQGRVTEHVAGFRMAKGQDQVWRLHGDQRVLDIEGSVIVFNGIYASVAGVNQTPCRSSGINFWIQDVDDGNNGGSIAYILVKGPGLPTQGLRYNAPSTGGNWRLSGSQEGGADGGNYHAMTGTCQTPLLSDSAIAALPDNAVYTLTAYTSSDVKVPLGEDDSGNYLVKMQAGRPLSRTELDTVAFPAFTAPASFAAFTSYAGGDLPITVTGLNPNTQGEVYLFAASSNGDTDAIERDVVPSSNGTYSTTLTLNLQAVQGKTLRATTHDASGRSVVTAWDYYPWP
ncbi:MAG: hypothetical protein EOP38_21680 [Rubrivivax sp.]|nr:MAG: hypothetical protein EOP38_21680 [Rubrivivax sp.]